MNDVVRHANLDARLMGALRPDSAMRVLCPTVPVVLCTPAAAAGAAAVVGGAGLGYAVEEVLGD
jgi:hypothetical protein